MTPLPPGARQNKAPLAACWTPQGRGAVATIRALGDDALWSRLSTRLFVAANGRGLCDQPIDRAIYGRWGSQTTEDVVVCRCDDRVLEIHCHGGEAASRRVLDDLEAVGFWIVSWTEMLAATEGRLQAECTEALARASTFRTASILLEQQSGALRRAIEGLANSSIPGAGAQTSGARSSERSEAARAIDELLRWSDFGLHLTRPWQVVLTGRPNVGKSSLINALLGYTRSIVYSEPGTTRDVVTAETAIDGWPVRLADTAGLRDAADPLESDGIERARATLREADCRLLLLDTSRPPHPLDIRLMAEWPDALLVAHKCDLPCRWENMVPARALRVSSATGEGIDELVHAVGARLVSEAPPEGTPIPVAPRQVECLRAAKRALETGDSTAFRARVLECLGWPAEHSPRGEDGPRRCA